jgi:uncharacterized membrane protein
MGHLARRTAGGITYNSEGMNDLTRIRRDDVSVRTARAAIPRVPAIRRYWFPFAFLFIGVYAGLPWLAPVLMGLGWSGPGMVIYDAYSTQCHQMAQRSYFLFGPAFMYSADQLQAVGVASDPVALRAFIGSAELGWKVAWSDRMVSMYSGLFVSMIGARLMSRRLRPLPAWGLILMVLPLALDGATHMLSDLAGIGYGFRDTNRWLAVLTSHRLPPDFYAGDAWGSFNADARLLTGALFAIGLAWFTIPRIGLSQKPGRAVGPPEAGAR